MSFGANEIEQPYRPIPGVCREMQAVERHIRHYQLLYHVCTLSQSHYGPHRCWCRCTFMNDHGDKWIQEKLSGG
jgi:hypothetical protein